MIASLLTLGYTYRFELREVADRVMAELVPGHAATRGRTVEIARGSGGGFSVAAQVNGARVPMVLDTGASAVVLTQEAAKAAGLPLEVLNYSVTVETANGRARAAPVTLDRLSIGGIIERSVPALIAQPGQLPILMVVLCRSWRESSHGAGSGRRPGVLAPVLHLEPTYAQRLPARRSTAHWRSMPTSGSHPSPTS